MWGRPLVGQGSGSSQGPKEGDDQRWGRPLVGQESGSSPGPKEGDD